MRGALKRGEPISQTSEREEKVLGPTDLASYMADMLHSLRACAKARQFKELEPLLRSAEIEALKIAHT